MFVPARSSRLRSPSRSSSLEPRRFGRPDRGARGPGGKRSRREMVPQRFEKIESVLGNGMVAEALNPQDLVHGRATDRARLRLTSRQNDKVAKLSNSQAGSGGGRPMCRWAGN